MTRLQSETTIRIKFSSKIKLSERNLHCVYVFLLVFIFSLSSFISSILYLSTHVSLSLVLWHVSLSFQPCVSLSPSLCVFSLSRYRCLTRLCDRDDTRMVVRPSARLQQIFSWLLFYLLKPFTYSRTQTSSGTNPQIQKQEESKNCWEDR